MKFATITSMAAAPEQMICEISHVITQPPFQTKPGDPGPDGGRIANPGDIATLAAAAAHLLQAAHAAVKAGTAVTLSPVARLSLALQPVGTAMFANSPFTEGKPNGFLSFRSEIWRDTDPDRHSAQLGPSSCGEASPRRYLGHG